jgi:hypothetical protein
MHAKGEKAMSEQQWHSGMQASSSLLTTTAAKRPLEIVYLSLQDTDPVTGDGDGLSAFFYQYYRGYTIYSNAQGVCCIHGSSNQGCLRLRGKYVNFPDIEDAKTLIKCFRARGIRSWECMERYMPECLNRNARQRASALSRPTRYVS